MRALIAALLVLGLSYSTSIHCADVRPAEQKPEQATEDKSNGAGNQSVAGSPVAGVNAPISSNLQPPTQKPDKRNERSEKNWWEAFFLDIRITDVLLALFTGLLVVVTWLLVRHTKNLWASTEKLVVGADRNAEKQLRAYMHVKNAHGSFDEKDIFWAKLFIHNFGQTPAYDVVQWVGIVGVDASDVPNISRPDDSLKKSKAIIGPGSHAEFVIPLREKITPGKKNALTLGIASIYVFGEISYRDVFDGRRITKYKLCIDGEGLESGNFRSTEEGNEAD